MINLRREFRAREICSMYVKFLVHKFLRDLLSFHFVCMFLHVTYAFQSESTSYSCLNVKELLARNRRDIWNLSDCNRTWTCNHLVRKRTFNHLAKLASLAKWLSVRLRTKRLWVRVLLQSLNFHFVFKITISKMRNFCSKLLFH